MVCELKIKELEGRLGRKLTREEKRRVEEKMHHNECLKHLREEEPITC